MHRYLWIGIIFLAGLTGCRSVPKARTPKEAILRYVQAVQQGDGRTARQMWPHRAAEKEMGRTFRALSLWVAFFLVFVLGGVPLYFLLRGVFGVQQPLLMMIGGMLLLSVLFVPLLRTGMLALVDRIQLFSEQARLEDATVTVVDETTDVDSPFVLVERRYPDGVSARDTVWVAMKGGGWVILRWASGKLQPAAR